MMSTLAAFKPQSDSDTPLYLQQVKDRLAQIKEGEAMLHITRVSYLDNGAAVELTHSYCRSDYYEFVAESRR